MEFVFEDKRGCILDKALQLSYTEDAYNHIHFMGNNGNAMHYAISEVEKGRFVVIYLDMVPGNVGIQQIYQKLKAESEQYDNRLLVMPIYGSEYLLIKAFRDLCIFKDQSQIQLCIKKVNYLDSSLYTSDKTKEDYRTFERYCKLVLERNTIDCACTASRIKIDGYGYIKNYVKNYFYSNDCKYKVDTFVNLELSDKLKRILESFEVLPSGNVLLNFPTCSWREAWTYHTQAIKELNNFSEAVKHRAELQNLCNTFEPITRVSSD